VFSSMFSQAKHPLPSAPQMLWMQASPLSGAS
jgi:hypothetical protein